MTGAIERAARAMVEVMDDGFGYNLDVMAPHYTDEAKAALKAALPETPPDEWVEKVVRDVANAQGIDFDILTSRMQEKWQDSIRVTYAALRRCVVGDDGSD